MLVLHTSPLLQSLFIKHCTQAGGLCDGSQTCAPAGQSLLDWQPVGGGAMQVLLDEQTVVCPEQSVFARHCTQEFPAGLTLQSGVAVGQSAAWVAVVQIGTQVLLEESQRSPAGHWLASTQATQVPGRPLAPGSQ